MTNFEPKFKEFAKGKFRCCAKKIFYTCPKTTLPLATFYKNCETLPHIDSFVCAQEKHKDGTDHIHALLIFKKEQDISSPRHFDKLAGKHPNFQGVRNVIAVFNYVTKGNETMNFNFSLENMKNDQKSAKKEVWFAVSDAKSTAEGLAILRDQDPESFFKYGKAVGNNLDSVHGKPLPEYVPDATFVFPYRVPGLVTTWINQYFTPSRIPRRKVLIVVGPTQLGKTAWARSLGMHSFVRGTLNIDKLHDNVKYWVFDDLDWKFTPNKKQLLLGMGEVELNEKYRAKRTIFNYKPAIWLCNKMPDFGDEEQYWVDNAVIVCIDAPLWVEEIPETPEFLHQPLETDEELSDDDDDIELSQSSAKRFKQ